MLDKFFLNLDFVLRLNHYLLFALFRLETSLVWIMLNFKLWLILFHDSNSLFLFLSKPFFLSLFFFSKPFLFLSLFFLFFELLFGFLTCQNFFQIQILKVFFLQSSI